MLRTADKRMRLGERLPNIFGGRAIQTYPVDYKPPRMSFRTRPPVDGYVAHYDPSDLDTVTRSAGVVSALADKTGSFDATASGSPLIAIPMGLFGGLPGIYFQSTYNFTSSAGMSDVTSSAFIVACADTIGSSRGLLCPSADGGIEFRIQATTGALTVNKSDVAGIGSQGNASVSAGAPFVGGYLLDASNCTTYNNLTSETDAHVQTITAGRTLVIGRAPSVATGLPQMAGWIGEIVMYDTTLSSGDATLVIQYLMTKWGIS